MGRDRGLHCYRCIILEREERERVNLRTVQTVQSFMCMAFLSFIMYAVRILYISQVRGW